MDIQDITTKQNRNNEKYGFLDLLAPNERTIR